MKQLKQFTVVAFHLIPAVVTLARDMTVLAFRCISSDFRLNLPKYFKIGNRKTGSVAVAPDKSLIVSLI